MAKDEAFSQEDFVVVTVPYPEDANSLKVEPSPIVHAAESDLIRLKVVTVKKTEKKHNSITETRVAGHNKENTTHYLLYDLCNNQEPTVGLQDT